MNAATGGRSEDRAEDRAAEDRDADDRAAEDWAAEDAELAQLVRPYTLTRGRTRHAGGASLDVIAQVVAVVPGVFTDPDGGDTVDDPEHQAILLLVQDRPLSVAEIAAGTDLPLGVVRILLGDLLEAGLVRVGSAVQSAERPDAGMLREVIRGLRAL